MIKKTILSVALFSSLFFIGCNKDDDPTPEEAAKVSLIGKWKADSRMENGSNVQPEGCEGEATISFNDEGMYTTVQQEMNEETGKCEAEAPITGTYTVSGDKLTVKVKVGEEEFDQEVTYTVSKDKLVLTHTYDDDGTSKTEIVSWKRVD